MLTRTVLMPHLRALLLCGLLAAGAGFGAGQIARHVVGPDAGVAGTWAQQAVGEIGEAPASATNTLPGVAIITSGIATLPTSNAIVATIIPPVKPAPATASTVLQSGTQPGTTGGGDHTSTAGHNTPSESASASVTSAGGTTTVMTETSVTTTSNTSSNALSSATAAAGSTHASASSASASANALNCADATMLTIATSADTTSNASSNATSNTTSNTTSNDLTASPQVSQPGQTAIPAQGSDQPPLSCASPNSAPNLAQSGASSKAEAQLFLLPKTCKLASSGNENEAERTVATASAYATAMVNNASASARAFQTSVVCDCSAGGQVAKQPSGRDDGD